MPGGFDTAYRRRTPLFGTTATKELVDFIDKNGVSGSALDLGCGDGRDTVALLRRGFAVTAVDESAVALAGLRRRCKGMPACDPLLTTIKQRVEKWQWPENKFEVVSAVTLLDHLAPGAIPEVCRRMVLATQKGGLVFAQVLTVDDPAVTGKGIASEFRSRIRHYFGPNELLRLFSCQVRVLFYEERIEWDLDHGQPHTHGMAVLLARRSLP